LDSQPPHTSGQLIGDRYRLEQERARGSQGVLWRASDRLAGEAPVALRCVGPDQLELQQAFRAIWPRLQGVLHPQVPRFGELIEQPGAAGGVELWLPREWQEGRSYAELLHDRAERQLVFGAGEVVLLLRQLLPALAVLHSQQLCHGDLSPANLLRRERDGLPVLLDFAPGGVTPGYAPPERGRGESPQPWMDLHGLGVVLYAGSLVWLIEGLSRAGLAVGSGRRLTPSDLYRWHGRCSRRVACGVINLLAALALAALVSFVAWSLVVFLLPGLSLVPAALGLALCLAVAMSQLFNPCLVLERALSPSQAFRRGVQLLERHWLGQLGLLTLLTAILLLPPLLGLLAEALLEGLGVVVTGVALVTVLPLLANSVTAAYLQLLPEFGVSQSGR